MLSLRGSSASVAADFDGDGSVELAATGSRGTQLIESRDVTLPVSFGFRELPGRTSSYFDLASEIIATAHGDGDGDGLDDVMISQLGHLSTAWGDGGRFARASSVRLDIGPLIDLASVDIEALAAGTLIVENAPAGPRTTNDGPAESLQGSPI